MLFTLSKNGRHIKLQRAGGWEQYSIINYLTRVFMASNKSK